MPLVTGWVFAIGCAIGTPATQCIEEPVNGYFYHDVESCKLDNAGDPRHNAKCVEVQVVLNPGDDASAGSIEKVFDSLDDSAGRE